MGTGGSCQIAGLALWPGAGGGRDHRALVALEALLEPLPVARREFPNRRAGKRGPERPAVAVASIGEDVAALAAGHGVDPRHLVIGGRSFGGRMCSVAVAEGLQVAGLVLLSYPLHPPGKPDRLRTEHFADIGVPCLFVSGDRDPFATPAELEAATGAIAGPVTHCWVRGAHDPKGREPDIAAAITAWLDQLG